MLAVPACAAELLAHRRCTCIMVCSIVKLQGGLPNVPLLNAKNRAENEPFALVLRKIFYSLSDPAEIILFQLFNFADRNPFPVAKQGIIFFRHLQQLHPCLSAIGEGRAAASGASFVFYGPNVHRLSPRSGWRICLGCFLSRLYSVKIFLQGC